LVVSGRTHQIQQQLTKNGPFHIPPLPGGSPWEPLRDYFFCRCQSDVCLEERRRNVILSLQVTRSDITRCRRRLFSQVARLIYSQQPYSSWILTCLKPWQVLPLGMSAIIERRHCWLLITSIFRQFWAIRRRALHDDQPVWPVCDNQANPMSRFRNIYV
jgi:hypothetical protein